MSLYKGDVWADTKWCVGEHRMCFDPEGCVVGQYVSVKSQNHKTYDYNTCSSDFGPTSPNIALTDLFMWSNRLLQTRGYACCFCPLNVCYCYANVDRHWSSLRCSRLARWCTLCSCLPILRWRLSCRSEKCSVLFLAIKMGARQSCGHDLGALIC